MKMTRVRLLDTCAAGKAGHIVDLLPSEAKRLIRAGYATPAPGVQRTADAEAEKAEKAAAKAAARPVLETATAKHADAETADARRSRKP